jgi:acetoacetyl-CoA synthetase
MILWKPSVERIKNSLLTKYQKYLHELYGLSFGVYSNLQDWSIQNPEQFWLSVWDFCQIKGEMNAHSLVDIIKNTYDFKKCTFFPKATLNFAENLLRRRDDEIAIVFWGEEQIKRSMTFKQLYDQVSLYRQGLMKLGVKPGDRVAGYLPNIPEGVVAMLAATSLGAIWSSCSPDFGVSGVLDRFGQIEPKVLFTADQFLQRGITHSILEKIPDIQKGLPTLEATIVLPYDGKKADSAPHTIGLKDFLWEHVPEEIAFEQFPFNTPLYIMFSSGTTGAPKCIIHGAGGTILQHMKEHQLHCDIKPGDRVFYFTTCGWMMWNWLVSTLASGATLMLYDGSPFQKKLNILFDYAQAEKMTFFGVSAKFIDAVRKIKLSPKDTHDLSSVRTMTSTGSPLMAESFEYVYTHIKKDIHLASISGGTDIISCFVLGHPNGPVYKGEIQAKGLGMAVEIFDQNGQPTHDSKGELVCTEPFPSKPLGFWNDQDGKKYHKAYFNRFSNIWCHGDFAEITAHDGITIYGRSDAVLNPGGVRIGTAEIYRPVESIEEVVECLATGYEKNGDIRIILFVRLQEGLTLTPELKDKIRHQIRINTSSYHVPAEIIQVPDIPRTKSGKIVEMAVRELIHGRPVKNIEALANPEALAYFERLAI